MRKLERMIRQALASFPSWQLLDRQSGCQHYVISNGKKKVSCSCSPADYHIAVKNLQRDIRRVESGVWQ